MARLCNSIVAMKHGTSLTTSRLLCKPCKLYNRVKPLNRVAMMQTKNIEHGLTNTLNGAVPLQACLLASW